MLRRILFGLLVFSFLVMLPEISQANTEQLVFEKIEQKPKPIRSKILHLLERAKGVNPKATAIALTATLGPFGAHRIYLGTHYTVPIFYTVTLGGGLGVLPASDLLVLIFSKDITKYYDNSKIFMWDVD